MPRHWEESARAFMFELYADSGLSDYWREKLAEVINVPFVPSIEVDAEFPSGLFQSETCKFLQSVNVEELSLKERGMPCAYWESGKHIVRDGVCRCGRRFVVMSEG